MESLMPAYQSAGVIVAVMTWDLYGFVLVSCERLMLPKEVEHGSTRCAVATHQTLYSQVQVFLVVEDTPKSMSFVI